MNRIRTTSSLAVLTLVALLTACSPPPPPQTAVKPLLTVKVGAGGTGQTRGYSGEIRPRIETTLAFQVGGKIADRRVNVGDHVNAGQVLALLDPKDLELALRQATAQHALAKDEMNRSRDLRGKGFVSQAALDAKQTALTAAEAQLDQARNQMRYAELIADRAGIVGQVLAEPGQVVAPGQPVFRMAPDGDREVAIAIPEADYSRFKLGQRARVSIFALPDQRFQGIVREIAPSADPATRTYAIRLALPGQAKLPTGLTVNVEFEGDAPRGDIPVPLTAIHQEGKQAAVWIVGADDTVSLRPVRVSAFRDEVALIAEGLNGGERIAAAGVNRLHPGQKVKPVQATDRVAP